MKRFACLGLLSLCALGGCLPTELVPPGIQTALEDLHAAVLVAIEDCTS